MPGVVAKAKRWLGYLTGDRHVEATGAVEEARGGDAPAPTDQAVERAERMVRREHQELD